mmetsp:Transcript_40302/g.45864  ORF Transcript_40302/g.45864 Transcript_40302/m.45864 type:complete len:140 (-) Transcript_40302:271-690(-)|eukprot:CAMPEP_0194139030 /NCGR_PEP_ID=MMETSP0152-20130528/8776_1 /TAXON_ID=1049557 /ORGANISM="Thalassiothrix antarctica, Strain L6-D1" /LENGTH=139 /DNA_ID=CAMNT_0038836741 /DNA_START=121 /DNA_END=540 /DNA_ORIENTATION=+
MSCDLLHMFFPQLFHSGNVDGNDNTSAAAKYRKKQGDRKLRYKLSKVKAWGLTRAAIMDLETADSSTFCLDLEPIESDCSTLSMESCGTRRWIDWRFDERYSPLRTGSDDFSLRTPITKESQEENKYICFDLAIIESKE